MPEEDNTRLSCENYASCIGGLNPTAVEKCTTPKTESPGEPGLPEPAGPHLLPRFIMHHPLVSEVSLHVNSFAAYKSSAPGGSHNPSYMEKT